MWSWRKGCSEGSVAGNADPSKWKQTESNMETTSACRIWTLSRLCSLWTSKCPRVIKYVPQFCQVYYDCLQLCRVSRVSQQPWQSNYAVGPFQEGNLETAKPKVCYEICYEVKSVTKCSAASSCSPLEPVPQVTDFFPFTVSSIILTSAKNSFRQLTKTQSSAPSTSLILKSCLARPHNTSIRFQFHVWKLSAHSAVALL